MSTAVDLSTAVEQALRAPSVHNTQPWRWRIRPGEVQLHADWLRHLPWTDPDRRDLLLSCGAALHHLRVALAAQGAAVRVDRLPDEDLEAHLATLAITRGEPDRPAAALFSAIDRRRTDRRRLSARSVAPQAIATLTDLARREDTLLLPITGVGLRQRLAEAFDQAAHEQAAMPGYAAELQLWTRRWAGARDGVTAGNVAVPHPSARGASALSRFPRAQLPQPRHVAGVEPADEAAEFIALATTTDDRLATLRAGEALSAVLLAATQMGLATTPLSQAMEVETVRREIRNEVLGTAAYPQLLVRVGWPVEGAGEVPLTSRRDLSSVLLRR